MFGFGSGRRIRTLTNRVRVCRATLTQSRYLRSHLASTNVIITGFEKKSRGNFYFFEFFLDGVFCLFFRVSNGISLGRENTGTPSAAGDMAQAGKAHSMVSSVSQTSARFSQRGSRASQSLSKKWLPLLDMRCPSAISRGISSFFHLVPGGKK